MTVEPKEESQQFNIYSKVKVIYIPLTKAVYVLLWEQRL